MWAYLDLQRMSRFIRRGRFDPFDQGVLESRREDALEDQDCSTTVGELKGEGG
jgi:hypothetical protein